MYHPGMVSGSLKKITAAQAASERSKRRVYWHCPQCDAYVPREQAACSCGVRKELRWQADPAQGQSLLAADPRRILTALVLVLIAVALFSLAR
jgi:hypothetical protein